MLCAALLSWQMASGVDTLVIQQLEQSSAIFKGAESASLKRTHEMHYCCN